MDRMSSIEMALLNERTEMQFYNGEAKRSNNPLAKRMFESLAQDEKEHMLRIQSLHQKLIAAGSWPKDMPLEVRSTSIRKVLEEQVRQSGSAEDHNQDDEKAIEKAIAFESKGETFYSDLASVCENPAEKSFFSFLSKMEREHRLSLVDSLAYLKDPESWMEAHERAGLDGA